MAKTAKKKVAAKKKAPAKKSAPAVDTNYQESYESMKEIVGSMEKDFNDFEQKGSGAAGARLRKAAHELVKLGRNFRKQVQAQRAANKAAK